MACLEKFGLADCNGVDKPISARLTVQDQPEVTNSTAQELYRGMVGSLLYVASWTRPDIVLAVSDLSRFISNPGKSGGSQASVPLPQENHESRPSLLFDNVYHAS